MAGKPSIARELFEEIRIGGAPFLRAMVNSNPPTFETEYLDFKGAQENGSPLPDGRVKKIWSEALAGFATTSGGVLVWGIDARKDGDGLDAASGFNLVPDPPVLRSRLQELLHQATDPPVVGVEILDLPEAAGSGFVACFIPESDYKPHRAESAGKRWCMRIGDSFVDVPPPVLRSLFFPHRQSYAYLKIGRTPGNNSQRFLDSTDFMIRLYNEGPATLDGVMLVVQRENHLSVVSDSNWLLQDAVDGWRLRSPNPIHAGEFVVVGQVSVRGSFNSLTGRFEFQLFARDQLPTTYTANASGDPSIVEECFPRPLELSRFRSRIRPDDLGD